MRSRPAEEDLRIRDQDQVRRLDTRSTLRDATPFWERAALGTGAAVVVAASVAVAWSLVDGNRLGIVLPLSGVVGLGMAVLAFTRFELFLMVVIAMRASLDAAKTSGSSLDATGALSGLFILAAAIWLYRHRDSIRAPSPVGNLLLPFASFFAAAALSVLFSSHPLDSGLEAVRIGTVVVIVITLARAVRDWEGARLLLFAIFGSALVPLAVAILEISRGRAGITAQGIGRINGTFLHPNPFAAYLSLLLILGVALFPHVGRRWRWALCALSLACAAVLVGTYARGAWLATFAGLLVVALIQHRRLLWLMGASILVVAISVPSVSLRLADLSETRSESGAPANSLAWRVEYWKSALALQDNPLFGIGLREVELNQEAKKAPHNDFVRVYVEMGLIGLATYLWLLGALLVQAHKAYRVAEPGVARGLAVAFLGSLTALVVLSVAANVVSQLVILWYFAAIAVLALTASKLPRSTTAAVA
jgi:putative inorganic carbon (HCO3(-)) transporter